MLSKAEMEEMWRTGPIGILKSTLKNKKGKKLYKVRITPYFTVDMHDHVKIYEVWAKRTDDAVWDAKNKWYQEHRDVNQTGIKVSMVA